MPDEVGLTPEGSFALWGSLAARMFDFEWEAYSGGFRAGAAFRRERQKRAHDLLVVQGSIIDKHPQPSDAYFEHARFRRLACGLPRDAAGELLQIFRYHSAPPVVENIEHALPRLYELLGLSPERVDAAAPMDGDGKLPPADGIPWDDRAPPRDLGHAPTVRLWCFLFATALGIEFRLGSDHAYTRDLQPGSDARRKLYLTRRVYQNVLAELWRLLPPGEWREHDDATWPGLRLGLSDAAARELAGYVRAAQRDHDARGRPGDGDASFAYYLVDKELAVAFGELVRDAPVPPPREPPSLDFPSCLLADGMAMFKAGDRPITREAFIRGVERHLQVRP